MVREYNRVSDDTRRKLIKHITDGRSIKEAAELVGINYENAKAINRIFKNETRVQKKKCRFRYRQGEDKNEMRKSRLEFQKAITKAKLFSDSDQDETPIPKAGTKCQE